MVGRIEGVERCLVERDMRTVQETQARDSGLVVVRSLVQRYGHGERREPDATERVAARVARYHQRRDGSNLDLGRVRRLDALSAPLARCCPRAPAPPPSPHT